MKELLQRQNGLVMENKYFYNLLIGMLKKYQTKLNYLAGDQQDQSDHISYKALQEKVSKLANGLKK